MPQAIASVLVSAGWGATAAAVAGYAIAIVGSLALSSYQKQKAARSAKAQYDAAQVDRLINLPSTIAPRELVLGRVRKGGTLFYRGTTGEFFNGNLWVLLAIASHEIDGVEQVYFNDQPVSINSEGMVTTLPYGGRIRRETASIKVTAQTMTLPNSPVGEVKCIRQARYFRGDGITRPLLDFEEQMEIPVSVSGSTVTLSAYNPESNYTLTYQWDHEVSLANVRIYLGGADQPADALMQSVMPPGVWTPEHRARGVAYVIANFLFDENAFQAGPPNITVRMRGAKCYDPRTGNTGWTENPALHMLHVLTHPQFGKRTLASVTAGEIASINAAANVCDIGTDYGQGQTQRFRSALVLPYGAAARDAFDDLSQAMGGMWAYPAGRLRVRAGVWQAPVMSLSDDDLAVVQRGADGAVSQSAISIGVHRARNDLFNTVVPKIWDQAANYIQTALTPVRIQALVDVDGAELSQEVVMPAVFYAGQANHVAGIMLRDARDPLTAVLPFKLKAYPLELFDSVTLSLKRYGWIDKEFIILGRTFTPEGFVQLTLKETSAAIYEPGAPVLPGGYADNTQLPRPWDIDPPTITDVYSGEEVLVVQGDGSILNAVRVRWEPITNPSLTSGSGVVEVQYRPMDVDGWQTVTVDGTSSEAFLLGLSDLQWIVIRARTRNRLASSDWGTAIYHQVIGKSAPPPDLIGLQVSGSVLSWSIPFKPADLAGYVFRFHYGNNTDWYSGVPLHQGLLTESPYDLVTRPGGVVTIMGKAQDTSGNVSTNAAIVVMNLGDPPIANVVETWDLGALGWPTTFGNLFADFDLRVFADFDGIPFADFGSDSASTGWTLVDGVPTADARDSFYGTDDQSFYRGDSESFYKEESYAQLVFVSQPIVVTAALAGSVMTVGTETEGIDLRIEYRLAGPGSFYGADDQPFYTDDSTPFYGQPGEWTSWPGQLVVARDAYQFRVTIGASAVRGRLLAMVVTVDAPDIVEEVADLPVDSSGTVIPFFKPFTSIKTVQATLQANGSGAVTVEIDKTDPFAPVVRAFDASHVAVSGATVDITLKGY